MQEKASKNKSKVLNFLLSQDFIKSLSNTCINSVYVGDLEYGDIRTEFIEYLVNEFPFLQYNSQYANAYFNVVKRVSLNTDNLYYVLYQQGLTVYDYCKRIRFEKETIKLNNLKHVDNEHISKITIEEDIYLSFYSKRFEDAPSSFSSLVRKYESLYVNGNYSGNSTHTSYLRLTTQVIKCKKLF
jgi:hypothetical protein